MRLIWFLPKTIRGLKWDANMAFTNATIARWVREHKQQTEETFNGHPSSRQLIEENRRLKKENQRLRMEREILKKAAAFFAKESE
jgi:transposase